ncbi:MAG: hypothetical protein M3509_12320, partial [Chloroflexota bacterium]|nr:hypothetical protein [Chloroflexota bacterium]
TMDQEAPAAPAAAVAAARRVVESAVIAVVTSTGLYLIGAVYTDAYYGRMSIEVTSLDLSPPYLALQSIYVLPGLLEYPTTLLVLYALYRLLSTRVRWLRIRYDRARRRFDRGVLLVTNLLVVAPLVVEAILASGDRRTLLGSAIVSQISGLLVTVVAILVAYALWLSFGPRRSIIAEVRQRRVIPIVLIFTTYLLNALVTTADTGAQAAELLMLGAADGSIAVIFTPADEQAGVLPAAELILVTVRQGNYVVVERQSYPPAPRPIAYLIPTDAVELARLQRLNAADLELDPLTVDALPITVASPVTPDDGDP